MDDLENQPADLPAPTTQELQAQLEFFRRSLDWVLMVMVVLSFAVFFFVWRNFKNTHRELERMRDVVDHCRVLDNNMRQFVGRLVDYSRTHPDFVPILTNHGIKPTPVSAPIPGLTNPPAAPPQQKK